MTYISPDMSKVNLMGNNLDQLCNLMVTLGEKPYKGQQLFKWLYKFQQYDFSLMTDMTKDLRTRLDDGYTFESPKLEKASKSDDGTEKFLFLLDNSSPVETVLIPKFENGRQTVCLSSQSGCGLGCRYCATGTMGLLRNLTVGEIVGQLVFIRDRFGLRSISSIVLMGMGEPLMNLDNVLGAIDIMTDEYGMDISPKRITVSTAGLPTQIRKMADAGVKAKLAVSLNTAIQEKREEIMPVAKSHHLDDLIEAVKYYAKMTKNRVTFEYIVFKGFNNTPEDVKAMAKLLRGVSCKINILAYNPVPGLDYERPSDEELDRFIQKLYPHLPAVTVRKSRGLDIEAACGQLAVKHHSGG